MKKTTNRISEIIQTLLPIGTPDSNQVRRDNNNQLQVDEKIEELESEPTAACLVKLKDKMIKLMTALKSEQEPLEQQISALLLKIDSPYHPEMVNVFTLQVCQLRNYSYIDAFEILQKNVEEVIMEDINTVRNVVKAFDPDYLKSLKTSALKQAAAFVAEYELVIKNWVDDVLKNYLQYVADLLTEQKLQECNYDTMIISMIDTIIRSLQTDNYKNLDRDSIRILENTEGDDEIAIFIRELFSAVELFIYRDDIWQKTAATNLTEKIEPASNTNENIVDSEDELEDIEVENELTKVINKKEVPECLAKDYEKAWITQHKSAVNSKKIDLQDTKVQFFKFKEDTLGSTSGRGTVKLNFNLKPPMNTKPSNIQNIKRELQPRQQRVVQKIPSAKL